MSVVLYFGLDKLLTATECLGESFKLFGTQHGTSDYNDLKNIFQKISESDIEAYNKLTILCKEKNLSMFRGKHKNNIFISRMRENLIEFLTECRKICDKMYILSDGEYGFQLNVIRGHNLYGFFDGIFTKEYINEDRFLLERECDKSIFIHSSPNYVCELTSKYRSMGLLHGNLSKHSYSAEFLARILCDNTVSVPFYSGYNASKTFVQHDIMDALLAIRKKIFGDIDKLTEDVWKSKFNMSAGL